MVQGCLTTNHDVHANSQIRNMGEILIERAADVDEDLNRGATMDRGEVYSALVNICVLAVDEVGETRSIIYLRMQVPGLSHENVSQMIHRGGHGDIDIAGGATRAAEVYSPSTDEGVGDFVLFEELCDESRGQA